MFSPATFRQLTKNDLAIFFALRLEALEKSPHGFLSAYQDEKEAGPAFFANILEHGSVDSVIWGAFMDEHLIGTVGVFRENKRNVKHKATVWGMYVKPDYRKHGIGKILFETALSHAKASLNCQVINLSVDAANSSAVKLYQSFGFEIWGTEPKAKMLNGEYFDSYHMALLL